MNEKLEGLTDVLTVAVFIDELFIPRASHGELEGLTEVWTVAVIDELFIPGASHGSLAFQYEEIIKREKEREKNVETIL